LGTLSYTSQIGDIIGHDSIGGVPIKY